MWEWNQFLEQVLNEQRAKLSISGKFTVSDTCTLKRVHASQNFKGLLVVDWLIGPREPQFNHFLFRLLLQHPDRKITNALLKTRGTWNHIEPSAHTKNYKIYKSLNTEPSRLASPAFFILHHPLQCQENNVTVVDECDWYLESDLSLDFKSWELMWKSLGLTWTWP